MSTFYLIGAGLTSATIARQLAEHGHEVVVFEKKMHAGGHAADYQIHDTFVNYYGPHFFHTKNKQVWNFASRFTAWKEIDVIFYAQPRENYFVPWPINRKTIEEIYKLEYNDTPEEAWASYQEDIQHIKPHIEDYPDQFNTFEYKAIDAIGFALYRNLLRNYSEHQWQRPADLIPGEIFTRIRVKEDYDPLFFPRDEHVVVPVDGYTMWVENMLDHRNISVYYGDLITSKEVEFLSKKRQVISTQPIDQAFDYCFGKLEYLNVDFHTFSGPKECQQFEYWPSHNINYNYPETIYTRGTAYHRIYGSNYPVVVLEEPKAGKEELYPIRTKINTAIYQKYEALAKEKNIIMQGRSGQYVYIDMWQAIDRALKLSEELTK